MPATLKIKNSSTLASVPSGLTAGEMAVNIADKKLYIGGTGGTNIIFLDSTSSVGSFNGLTGAVQGVSAAVAGTGISVSGATGSVTITNTGVQTFNGLTGAVTGITAGGANTFTQLNTFSAGISASGATFASDISVNSLTVGRGRGGLVNNVAVGNGALAANTTGNGNIGVGTNALDANTIGTDNLGVGTNALGTNINGINNVGLACDALFTNSSGGDNIAVGCSALYSNSSGGNNVGLGTNALGVNNTGNSNIGLGANALGANTTGSTNVGIGRNAGRYRGTATDANSTGQGGIYIGYQARGSTLAQTNEIVIGVDALGLGSNTAVIGATAQSAATIYGRLNLPGGLSAAGTTFSGNVNLQDNVLSRVELLDYFERYVDRGDFTDKGNTIPIDLSTGQVFRVRLTVTGSSGLTVSNVPDNGNANAVGFTLLLVGDGTARVMTWNIGGTAVTWAGGTAPTYTTTNNKTDVYSFLTRDGGTTWFGFVGGQNF